jgi:hypothetical protein
LRRRRVAVGAEPREHVVLDDQREERLADEAVGGAVEQGKCVAADPLDVKTRIHRSHDGVRILDMGVDHPAADEMGTCHVLSIPEKTMKRDFRPSKRTDLVDILIFEIHSPQTGYSQ